MFTLGKIKLAHLSTYGLALFFVLLPFEYPLASIGSQSILMLVGVMTIVLSLGDIAIIQRFKFYLNYKVVLSIVWLIYAGVSILWCNYRAAFLEYYKMYFRNCFMFVIISMIQYNKDEAYLLKKSLTLGVGLLMLYMSFVPGAIFYSDWQHRLLLKVGDSYFDPNYLSAILLMGFGFMLYWIINHKKAKMIYKLGALAYCGGCFYYIIATGSRSGLIAEIVMLIILLGKSIKKNLLIVLIMLLLIVIASPYIISLFPDNLLERYSLKALTGNTSESSGRLLIWSGLLSRLKGIRVLIGYGAGSSAPITREVYQLNGAAHSFYIGHVVELGLIGFSIFMFLIVKMAKKLLKSYEEASFAMFVCIMVVGAFLDLLTTKFFWSTMMIVSIIATDTSRPISN